MNIREDYNQYYNPHIRCDWCGILTRGRIYDDNPNSVVCGSCHQEILPLDAKKERAKEGFSLPTMRDRT